MRKSKIDWDTVRDLYENTTMTQGQIGGVVGCADSHISTWARKNYTKAHRRSRKTETYSFSKLGSKNPMLGKTGEKHHCFVGPTGDCKGYMLVLKPSWWTGRKKSKHIFEHHFVYCKHNGMTEVPAGMHIHHLNGDKVDNRIQNLIMLPAGDHTKLHRWLKSSQNLSNKTRED